MIQYRIIDQFDEFLKLEQPWNELVEDSEVDHAFMKFQWFAEWIKAYEVCDSLSIVSLWRDGLLSAVAPIHRKPLRFRMFSARGLSFLSSGVSPRCNFITSDLSLMDDLVDRVLSLRGWDIFYTANLEAGLPTTERYIEAIGSRSREHRFQIEQGLRSPFLNTEGTWEEYWNSLDDKRRAYLERMCLRRLRKAESYEVDKIASEGQFRSFAPSMFRISGKSWKAAADDHLERDSPLGRLYLGFTPLALERGWVALYLLKIENQIAGFEYLFSSNGKYSLVRCDYDEGFKYYSPGNSLRLAILKDLFDRDVVCEYDMAGDDYPYKLEWCRSIREHVSIHVGNNNVKGRAILLAKSAILPSMRRLKGWRAEGARQLLFSRDDSSAAPWALAD